MKQIPNLFTLLNLIFGCIAIVMMLQTGETIVTLGDGGATQVMLPEKIVWGAVFIFGAAIIDFLDGFLARLFKASSEMGKQLDSLSDVVSFGVAPGIVLYQLLRMSYAQELNGLDVSFYALLPAFIYSASAAWRLAKFNISTDQVNSFSGVPSPAAGLFIASLPLILNQGRFAFVNDLILNKYVIYLLILIVSYLMVSNKTFMALKFNNYSAKDNGSKYALLLVS
ncbi:MAG TPA: CDP-alcohol phosphatidyltransferase family protein, partial [Flavisolibacter sp.]|nr:CDP-alcohol phosphatidyltransferase family protein [Flavisolibacter sp.]